MREVTVVQARCLKPGTNVLLHNHCRTKRFGDYLVAYIVSKEDAKKKWGKQFKEYDIWYLYEKDRCCYTMMADAKKFCWSEVYVFDGDEIDKIRLLLEVDR
jgi:hypothetical protein